MLGGLASLASLLLPCLPAAQAPALSQAPADFRYLRTVAVARAGWVRVSLDGPTQAHGRAPSDWRVFGPDGRPVRLAMLSPVAGDCPVRTLSAAQESQGSGHLLVFDLGPTPLLHRRLEVVPQREVEARGCRLEGSRDRVDWAPIASGDLFRLGSGQGLQQTTISYAPTDVRYLRLSWPASAGFPSLKQVTVEAIREFPGGPASLSAEVKAIDYPGAQAAFVLTAPSLGLPFVSLELEIEAASRFGYRTSRLQEARWFPVADGVAEPAGGVARLSLPVGGDTGSVDRVLVRLFTKGGEKEAGGPRLASGRWLLPPLWALFEAPASGVYTLAYGSLKGPPSPVPPLALEQVAEPLVDLRLDEGEKTTPRPPLPAERVQPGVPSREPSGGARYRVVAEGAEPGTVVRLELPEIVSRELSAWTTELRLRAGGRDVPFLRWSPPLPALALDLRDLSPAPIDMPSAEDPARRRSRLVVDLPETKSLVNRLELSAAQPAFEREIEFTVEKTRRPGVEDTEWSFASEIWKGEVEGDEGDGILPQELILGIQQRLSDWERLVVTFHDGDREPLRSLRLLLWRRREAIAFVWPAAAGKGGAGKGPADEEPTALELVIVQGSGRGSPPRNLEDLEGSLLALPWVEARLDIEGAAAGEEAAERARRTWLTIALAVVAIVLFGVLARSLRGASPAGGEKRPIQ